MRQISLIRLYVRKTSDYWQPKFCSCNSRRSASSSARYRWDRILLQDECFCRQGHRSSCHVVSVRHNRTTIINQSEASWNPGSAVQLTWEHSKCGAASKIRRSVPSCLPKVERTECFSECQAPSWLSMLTMQCLRSAHSDLFSDAVAFGSEAVASGCLPAVLCIKGTKWQILGKMIFMYIDPAVTVLTGFSGPGPFGYGYGGQQDSLGGSHSGDGEISPTGRDSDACKVYISKVAKSWTSADLQDVVSDFGQVLSCHSILWFSHQMGMGDLLQQSW